MLRKNSPPVLILESDSAWDVNIRPFHTYRAPSSLRDRNPCASLPSSPGGAAVLEGSAINQDMGEDDVRT